MTIQTRFCSLSWVLLTIVTLTTLKAQAPQVINYQAVVRDAAGEIVKNKAVNFRLSILDGGPSGTPQYVETQSKTTNQFGLVTFGIGQGSTISGTMNAITWSTGNKFFKVELDINGGNNFSVMSTSQFLSVPYALYAANGGSATAGWGLSGNTATSTDKLGTNNAQDLRFVTNATQKAVLTANGYLGLGTTNPVSQLSVETNSDGFGEIDGRLMVDIRNTSTSTASQAIMRMTAGNAGNFTNLAHTASTYTVGPDRDAGVLASTGAGGLVLRASPKSGSDPDVGAIRFQTGWNAASANGTTERMRLDKNGNLGIGTTNPVSRLSLEANADGSGAIDGRYLVDLKNTSTSNASTANLKVSAGNSGTFTVLNHHSSTYTITNDADEMGQLWSTGKGLILRASPASASQDYNGSIRFYTGWQQAAFSSNERMRIEANGNVGIGTTTPKAKVEVANGDVYLTDPTKGIILKSPNGNCWRVTVDNTGNLVRTQITCPQ